MLGYLDHAWIKLTPTDFVLNKSFVKLFRSKGSKQTYKDKEDMARISTSLHVQTLPTARIVSLSITLEHRGENNS